MEFKELHADKRYPQILSQNLRYNTSNSSNIAEAWH